MSVRHLSVVALTLLALTAVLLSGCPGALEDPDRFDEPDASTSDAGSDS